MIDRRSAARFRRRHGRASMRAARARRVAMRAAAAAPGGADARPRRDDPRVLRYVDETPRRTRFAGGASKLVQRGDLFENWTVMEIVPGAEPFVGARGFPAAATATCCSSTPTAWCYDFGKSLEPTFAGSGPLWLGHTREEVIASARDLLADEILARPGDPDYAQIAGDLRADPQGRRRHLQFRRHARHAATRSASRMAAARRTSSRRCSIRRSAPICEPGKVWNGLVGGYLPVLRFVYPQDNGDWTEYPRLRAVPHRRWQPALPAGLVSRQPHRAAAARVEHAFRFLPAVGFARGR